MDFFILAQTNVVAILITVVIGAICGYLAGQILRGRGLGLIPNIVVGILGAALFSWLGGNFELIKGVDFVNEIIGGTIGSVILLFLIGLIKKAT